MENFGKLPMKKTTSEQFELLANFLKENQELASNKPLFGGSKSKCEKLWADITGKLNSIGPPTRDVMEWKKVWSDLKGRTKRKICSNHQSLTATGGGPFQMEALTPLEEIVDGVLNLRRAAVPPGDVYGCEKETSDEIPSTSCKEPTTKKYESKCQKRTADVTTELLREQVEQQKIILKSMKKISDTLEKNTAILQQHAEATEKIAMFAEKFFMYLTSD